jgi:hypothetical protein
VEPHFSTTGATHRANLICRVAMTNSKHVRVALALAVCLAGGCQLFPGHKLAKGHSPLKPAQPSPDSVAVEIIWARFPANDAVFDDAAWREIDETQFEPSVRKELLNNGFRAGVISGAPPAAVAKVLHHGESKSEDSASAAERQNATLNIEPIVHGRTLRVRRNQRSELQASEVFPSLPLLVSGGTELGGRTYEQAQAIYALRVDPRPDRTALVELTPELHCGEARLRFTGGDDGILRQASLRERKVFEHLRFAVRLAPGEMLVLMTTPDSGSRLGHYFHTADSPDGLRQKLVLIRLAEVPQSDTFAAANEF